MQMNRGKIGRGMVHAMTIDELEEEMRRCRKCEPLFANRYVDPIEQRNRLQVKPIFAGAHAAPIMLVGQAPGIREYERGMPFQGRAGGEIRGIFRVAGVSEADFDALVYQTSVTKCFPGRRKVRHGTEFREEDLQPSAGEVKNCLPYLGRQIDLINPRVLVLLGRAAIDGWLHLAGRRFDGGLVAYVGRSEKWLGKSVVFLPHTSGSSRWLNSPENRRLLQDAQTLLANVLRSHQIVA
jgi:uracil-DNA glycosylase family 4